MKSRFLKKLELSEGFKSDLKTLVDANSQTLKDFINWFFTIKDYINIQDHEIKTFADEKLNGDMDVAKSLLSITIFLLKNILDTKDKVADVVNDMVELKLLQQDKTQEMNKYLESVMPATDTINKQRKSQNYTFSGVPYLSSLGITLSFRIQLKEEFDIWGNGLDKYVPEVEDLIPVTNISLVLLIGEEEKRVNFQADERTLDLMLNRFNAAKKEIQSLKKLKTEAFKK